MSVQKEIYQSEEERLKAINEYSILDSMPEEEYEKLTKLAAEICDTPIALITILDSDRQWFKSHYGIPIKETPLSMAFCTETIKTPLELTIVPDTRLDERFSDNPFVAGKPHITFYAGVPLLTSNGIAIGALCILDTVPREISIKQVRLLEALSRQVIRLFELRKANRLLEENKLALEVKNSEIEKFAYIVSHDLKSPLNNIIQLVDNVIKENKNVLPETGLTDLEYIKSASLKLKQLTDGILRNFRSEKIIVEDRQEIDVNEFVSESIKLLDPLNLVKLSLNFSTETIVINKIALEQIFLNLLSNSIKYNDKPETIIEISLTEREEFYVFSIGDNGSGIETENINSVFEIFQNIGKKDKNNVLGSGIGLSTVKNLVEKLGGTIEVDSVPGEGTVFTFTVKRFNSLSDYNFQNETENSYFSFN